MLALKFEHTVMLHLIIKSLLINRPLKMGLLAYWLIFNPFAPISHADEIRISENVGSISAAEKNQLGLAEIEAEARAADRAKNGYYVERKSYGTGKETDPPRYVKPANKTWLKDYDAFLDNGTRLRVSCPPRDS